ncbi:transcriptional regulator TbsP domain-containing protein [Halorubrum sp. DTA98]|uniref:transcriptional regulator TbsP domain-containing protein n=1 Tax=Halorubrum sp. DTA98 TaxID=3402163 RepID=UPI003AB0C693
MASDPELPLATGTVSLGSLDDPLIVDPGPDLLEDVVTAFAETVPTIAAPDLDALSTGARSDGTPLAPPPDRPSVAVLAERESLLAVTDGFHAASRVAGLVESGLLSARLLDEPQPNPMLAGRERGTVLVETDAGRYPVGADRSARDRYAEIVDGAEPFRLTTPSRHRLYGGFHARCSPTVADDVIATLDVDPDPGSDVVDPRVRAYLVGARHEVLDHTLRRACEDAGLGSPSTFTEIKRRLVDAGLVDTVPVSQPVGRPRKRLVACGPLSGTSVPESVAVARDAFGE